VRTSHSEYVVKPRVAVVGSEDVTARRPCGGALAKSEFVDDVKALRLLAVGAHHPAAGMAS